MAASKQTTAMAPLPTNPEGKTSLVVKDRLESARTELAKYLTGTGLTVDRVINVATAAIARDPKLQECTPSSLIKATIRACELGLEIGGSLQHCFFVPFNNKVKQQGKPDLKLREAQCIIGYRGQILLMEQRCESFSDVFAEVVYRNDYLRVRRGTVNELEHEPLLEGERGTMMGVYAVVQLKNGKKKWHYMTMEDIERIRMMSSNGKDWDTGEPAGFWKTHYPEMAKKSAIRQLFKTMPISSMRERELVEKLEEYDLEADGVVVRHQPQQQRQLSAASLPPTGDEYGSDEAPEEPPQVTMQPPPQPPSPPKAKPPEPPAKSTSDLEAALDTATQQNLEEGEKL